MEKECHRIGAISSPESKKKAYGCITALYHLFDPPPPSKSKGLKVTEESHTSKTYEEKLSLNVPVSMRVRTETETERTRLKTLSTDTSTYSSEMCNSPNLVARLMGLDLLPHKTQPNHSLTNRLTSNGLSKSLGTRSLPESPRISSFSRKSDFDIHRLSLQMNKENTNGFSRLKQDQEEKNQSPRNQAKQHVVKKIKERVVATKRVVGIDITNSVKNRVAQNPNELRRDSIVPCSPRTRFSDKENLASTLPKTLSSSFRPEEKRKPTTVDKQSQSRVKQIINQCKKAESETRRPLKPSQVPNTRIKQRQAFLSKSTQAKAYKSFKKLPKSNSLVTISATGPPLKQTNERDPLKLNEEGSICLSLTHKIEKHSPKLDDGIDSKQDYIRRTMNSPSIFRKLESLEENPPGSLPLRCNRRMCSDDSELIRELCFALPRFGSKSCPVPGEIVSMGFEEEEEEEEIVVAEIEREITDGLLRETAYELGLKTTRINFTKDVLRPDQLVHYYLK